MSVVHGGIDEGELRALGIDAASVLDLSANLHPAGPSAPVLRAAHAARLDRYPPADARPLREAIARHEGIEPEWVLPTPGATAAIHLIARAVLARGDEGVIFPPAFGEYAAAIEAAGGVARTVACAPGGFEPELPRAAPLGYLANPNNPTGTYLPPARVAAIASTLDGLLVVDAAYEPFVEGASDALDLVRNGLNVAVVRSMTKLHAIPGVRLGYVLAAPPLIARLAALQPSWSLDATAQAAGPVALAEHHTRIALLREVWETRESMRAALAAAGFVIGPSRANFLFVEVGDAPAARLGLLQAGVLVRDCTSFGLPSWIRVAVPRRAEADRVTAALLSLRAPSSAPSSVRGAGRGSA